MKGSNLAVNPNCVVSTQQDGEVVVVEGVAQRVAEPDVNPQVFAMYEQKYNWNMRSMGNVIYRMSASVVFGMDEKKSPDTFTRWELPAQSRD
jgi:hypothetical protein